jgi:hypothetical protein
MRGFMYTVPLFLPALALAIVLAIVLARPLARRLDSTPLIAATLVAGLGLIVAATLTPLVDALEDGIVSSGACDTSRLGFAPIGSYLRISSVSLNVLLFVPFGLAAGLLPRSRRTTAILAAGLTLPLVVEVTQMLVPALGRGCEVGDIVDNTMGYLIGVLLGRMRGVLTQGASSSRTA